MFDQSVMGMAQDGPLRSSNVGVIADQVCCVGQSSGRYLYDKQYCSYHMYNSNPPYFSAG
jgi:hypothetical protein